MGKHTPWHKLLSSGKQLHLELYRDSKQYTQLTSQGCASRTAELVVHTREFCLSIWCELHHPQWISVVTRFSIGRQTDQHVRWHPYQTMSQIWNDVHALTPTAHTKHAMIRAISFYIFCMTLGRGHDGDRHCNVGTHMDQAGHASSSMLSFWTSDNHNWLNLISQRIDMYN